jgi:hypothetical protein
LLAITFRQPATQDFEKRQLLIGSQAICCVNDVGKGHFCTEFVQPYSPTTLIIYHEGAAIRPQTTDPKRLSYIFSKAKLLKVFGLGTLVIILKA